VLSIGALMAASSVIFQCSTQNHCHIEVDFRVSDQLARTKGNILHVWLQGEPYAAHGEGSHEAFSKNCREPAWLHGCCI